jgi:hypothetical protein
LYTPRDYLEAVCLAISLGIGTLIGLVERTLGKRIFGADGGGQIVVHQSGRGKSEPAPVRIDRSWSVAATSGRRSAQILTTPRSTERVSPDNARLGAVRERLKDRIDQFALRHAVGNPHWFGPPHNVFRDLFSKRPISASSATRTRVVARAMSADGSLSERWQQPLGTMAASEFGPPADRFDP